MLGLRMMLAGLLTAAALGVPATAGAAPFTVDNVSDAVDAATDGVCATSTGTCTLRAALGEANATAAADTIAFDAATFDGSAAATIPIATALSVTQPVTIDGGNCGTAGAPKPCAGIDAGDATNGFVVITGGAVSIRGLAVTNAVTGVLADSGGASGLVVAQNWFGRRLDGSAGSNAQGVNVADATSGVTIGGTSVADRNRFQHNATAVALLGDDNQVVGNDFGIDPGGAPAGPNTAAVDVDTSLSDTIVPDGNVIGGPDTGTPAVCDGACNAIAGGALAIRMGDAAVGEVDNTTIAGNFIGIDPSGTHDYGTTGSAIVNNQADGTTVGGPTAADRNYIGDSGNANGVSGLVAAAGAEGLVVRNNFFGLNAAGTSARPDASRAIDAPLTDPATIADNRFGATASAPVNGAIRVRDEATITGNTFGVGTGGEELGGLSAPWINVGGDDNTIGGDASSEENVLSNGGGTAIELDNNGVTGTVDGNRILRNRGAGNDGVFIDLRPPIGLGNGPDGPNDGIEAPPISGTPSTTSASGTGARVGATIRVFEVASGGTVTAFAGSVTDGDGGAWTATISGVGNGDCIVATQTDAAGNSSELSLPATVGGGECDTTPPGSPQIQSGPFADAASSDTTPTWTWGLSEPGQPEFECRVYAFPGAAPAFSACSGPGTSHTADPLADGVYRFEVRARDEAGNTGIAAVASFAIDTVAPVVSILAPAAGATTSATPTFTFAADEDPVEFECGVDGAPLGACSGAGEHAPSSPLAAGAHTFRVRAIDEAGHESDVVTRAFTVAAPAGETSGDGVAAGDDPPPAETPPGPDPSPAPGADVTPAPAADRLAPAVSRVRLEKRGKRRLVRFTLSEAGTVRIVLERRVRGRFRRVGALTRAAGAGANSLRLPAGLARRLRGRGAFRVVLVATDAAGNRSARVRRAVQR